MVDYDINKDPYNRRSALERGSKETSYDANRYKMGASVVRGYNPKQWEQAIAGQGSLADTLKQRAEGKTTSAAEIQAKRDLGRISAQAHSLAAKRGVSSGLAARLASKAKVDASAQASESAALLRAQEQAQAEQALGGVLGDISSQRASQADIEQQRYMADERRWQ